MHESLSVYDLGEIRARPVRRPGGPRPRPVLASARSPVPACAATLSMVVPGAGHLMIREPVMALLFASTFGFASSLAWALAVQFEPLVRTLVLLGAAAWWAVMALAASLLAAAALHVTAVVQALRHASETAEPASPPGVVAGLASAFVPGWGQALSGRAAAAAVFLSLGWGLVLTWAATTPVAQALVRPAGVGLPRAVLDGWGPIALVSTSVLVWALGFYDAAAGAVRRRS